MQCEGSQILYDDDAIRVIWQPGRSDFVLVTFGDLITLANGKRFFADAPAGKAGIACIGVMAKAGNWFPQAAMHAAAVLIRPMLEPYRARVLYGGSMGGYAALKFSRLLSATQVVALCPQWSIDSAECEGASPGWGQYFRPEMAGMGIRPHDLAGEAFLFVDLTDRTDRFHCRMIERQAPGSRVVNVPFVGHHVTAAFAGTQNLLDLIQACRADDRATLARLSRTMRRHHVRRLTTLIDRAIARKPHAAFAALAKLPARTLRGRPYRLDLVHALYFRRTATWLWTHRSARAAVEYLNAVQPWLSTPRDQVQAAALLNQIKGQPSALVSHAGVPLVLDPSTNRCVHREREAADCLIRMQVTAGSAMLFVELGGIRFDLVADAQGLLGLSSGASGQDVVPRFELEAPRPGVIALRQAGAYLSAERSGRVVCNRPAAREWELFRLGCGDDGRPSAGAAR